MKRTYLEEDIELIRAYFPGARAIPLRTPFDLSKRNQRHEQRIVERKGRAA
ncbi:MAG TPA: hypothetical protein VLF59_06060 [Candidatus Saccharimonadales bacterium]|nr:hypothetical protein [Candidatus Saccharimonadales bacterium]